MAMIITNENTNKHTIKNARRAPNRSPFTWHVRHGMRSCAFAAPVEDEPDVLFVQLEVAGPEEDAAEPLDVLAVPAQPGRSDMRL